MRGLLLGAVVGLLLLAVKVKLWFVLYALPILFDLASAVAFLVAVVALILAIQRKKAAARAGAVVLALFVAGFDVPIVRAVADRRVTEAEAYCEAASAHAVPSGEVPTLPGRARPD